METKKILAIVTLVIISLFIFSGCSSNSTNINNGTSSNTNGNSQNKVVPNESTNSSTISVSNSSDEQVGSQIITDNDTVQIGDMI